MLALDQCARWCWVLSGTIAVSLAAEVQAELPLQTKPEKAEAKKSTDPLFPFTISQETTRITEPLKPDGTVDYAAALNARLGKGVTPESNAAVPLMRAFGANAVPEASREAFFQALGIAVPDAQGSLINFGEFVEQNLKQDEGKDNGQQRQAYFDQQSQAMHRPWSRKEFPLVADWVDANAEALKLVLQASQKPRLFIPLVVEKNKTLIDASLDRIQSMRALARILTARAMLALEEGRIEEAQNDLLACHRLASLMGQRPTMMVEVLVSYAIDATAARADLALAQSEKVTQEQLAAYRQKLAALPALPSISETIDQGERFCFLDIVSGVATKRPNFNFGNGNNAVIPNAKLFNRMLKLSIDWDLILKRGNKKYDQIVAALNLETYAERQAEIAKMEAELKKLREEAGKPGQIALMLLGVDPPRAVVSRQIGNALVGLLLPAVRQAANAETRAHTRRDLTIIAFALAEYQREHGQYPESLSDLSPKYLKTIPKDRFTDTPLKYQRQETGYLLYSVGSNGKDDKGQGRSRNGSADDWAIRVPSRPEL